jgi:hypothetical protein
VLAELRLVSQLALGCVFLFALAGKLRDPRGFARGVVDYDILPATLAYWFGFLLLPLEGFLAAAHLTGWALPVAAPMGVATLASFALAVGINLRRGRGLPCFCFGSGEQETLSLGSLARLLLLLAGELFVWAGPAGWVYPDHLSTPLALVRAAMATALLLVSASWLLGAGEIVELFRPCTTCGGGGVRFRRRA